MTKEHIEQTLEDFYEIKNVVKDGVINFCQDKDINLDERWEVFEKAHNLGLTGEYPYIIDMPPLVNEHFEEFYVGMEQRLSEISVFEFVEEILEDNEGDISEELAKDIAIFKEDCMYDFYGSFIFDW